MDTMSTAPALAVYNKIEQAIMPKSTVPDLRQFDGDQMKFEDQQRGIQLFFKNNRVTMTDNRITAILAQLREGIIGIYA